MRAYIYCADLLCEDCGAAECAELDRAGMRPAGLDPDNESTWDSDEYPKGPYPDGGGEADYAAHCGACGVHLANPLTGDGVQHVADSIEEFDQGHGGAADVIATWREFYRDELEQHANSTRAQEAHALWKP